MATRWKQIGVVVGMFSAPGCIGAESGSWSAKPTVAHDNVRASRTAMARSALERCHKQFLSDEYASARQSAEGGLQESQWLTLDMQAELFECRANAGFGNGDEDVSKLYEAAVQGWERVPKQAGRLVRALNFHGRALAAHANLARSEQQYKRALALEESGGIDLGEVGRTLYGYYEVLDEECRADEAEKVLARLEQVYRDRPSEVPLPGVDRRFRSMLARRRGDLDLASRTVRELLHELDASKADSEYYDWLAQDLFEYERDRGSYVAALQALQQGLSHISEPNQWAMIDLAFAYEAAEDTRLAELDRMQHLQHASTGKQLFPRLLPAIEPCQPDPPESPGGRASRIAPAEALIQSCIDKAPTKPTDISFLKLVMRIEGGKVVAAGVRAKSTDSTIPSCVADGALRLQVPGPHDFNFYQWSYPE